MKHSYLIFIMEAVSFLLPLRSVVHILPASAARENMEYEGHPVRFHGTACLLPGKGRKIIHAVVLKNAEEYHAVLAEQVLGVEELSDQLLQELPAEVRWEKNRFLQAAVKLEESGNWAYLLDVEQLLKEESKDEMDAG